MEYCARFKSLTSRKCSGFGDPFEGRLYIDSPY